MIMLNDEPNGGQILEKGHYEDRTYSQTERKIIDAELELQDLIEKITAGRRQQKSLLKRYEELIKLRDQRVLLPEPEDP